MFDCIMAGHEVNKEVVKFINSIVAEIGKEKFTYESCVVNQELYDAVKELAEALIRLRGERFAKWPDAEEKNGFVWLI